MKGRGIISFVHPHLDPPPLPSPKRLRAGRHQGGGKSFRELDAPQLCCGVLHYARGFNESVGYQAM
jgi:hypothetical protein